MIYAKLWTLTEFTTTDMMLHQHLRKDILVKTEMRVQFKTNSVLVAQLLWFDVQRADKLG